MGTGIGQIGKKRTELSLAQVPLEIPTSQDKSFPYGKAEESLLLLPYQIHCFSKYVKFIYLATSR